MIAKALSSNLEVLWAAGLRTNGGKKKGKSHNFFFRCKKSSCTWIIMSPMANLAGKIRKMPSGNWVRVL